MQLLGYIKALTWIHPLHAIREFHLARAVVVVYPNRVGIRLGQCACGVEVVPSPSRICDDRMCRREIPGGRCHEYCSDTMHLSFSPSLSSSLPLFPSPFFSCRAQVQRRSKPDRSLACRAAGVAHRQRQRIRSRGSSRACCGR